MLRELGVWEGLTGGEQDGNGLAAGAAGGCTERHGRRALVLKCKHKVLVTGKKNPKTDTGRCFQAQGTVRWQQERRCFRDI